jgi:16S rRNA pseudouridine516 synthase
LCAEKKSSAERLDKILSNGGFGSRKDVKKIIRKNLVSVNGEIVSSGEIHVDAEKDEICVDGKIFREKKNAYFMMNKVRGSVCSKKSDGCRSVFEFLSAEDNRKYPGGNLNCIGRLDADTEGLLILTSDGEMVHRITSPKNGIPKTYLVFLKREVSVSEKKIYAEKLAQGIHIEAEGREEGADCKPCEIEWCDKKMYHGASDETPCEVCRLTVTEGKFHEVKRIFKALKNEVAYLKRIRINGLFLDEKIPAGGYRPLTENEIKLLDGKND